MKNQNCFLDCNRNCWNLTVDKPDSQFWSAWKGVLAPEPKRVTRVTFAFPRGFFSLFFDFSRKLAVHQKRWGLCWSPRDAGPQTLSSLATRSFPTLPSMTLVRFSQTVYEKTFGNDMTVDLL